MAGQLRAVSRQPEPQELLKSNDILDGPLPLPALKQLLITSMSALS